MNLASFETEGFWNSGVSHRNHLGWRDWDYMMDSSRRFILRDDASAPRIPIPLFVSYTVSKEINRASSSYLPPILEQTLRTCVWEAIHCFRTEQVSAQHSTSFPRFSPTRSERSTSSPGSSRFPILESEETLGTRLVNVWPGLDLARASTWRHFPFSPGVIGDKFLTNLPLPRIDCLSSPRFLKTRVSPTWERGCLHVTWRPVSWQVWRTNALFTGRMKIILSLNLRQNRKNALGQFPKTSN